MASSSPTLEEIIIASKRDEASVLNVFLVGSRAWGTETADSDWYMTQIFQLRFIRLSSSELVL